MNATKCKCGNFSGSRCYFNMCVRCCTQLEWAMRQYCEQHMNKKTRTTTSGKKEGRGEEIEEKAVHGRFVKCPLCSCSMTRDYYLARGCCSICAMPFTKTATQNKKEEEEEEEVEEGEGEEFGGAKCSKCDRIIIGDFPSGCALCAVCLRAVAKAPSPTLLAKELKKRTTELTEMLGEENLVRAVTSMSANEAFDDVVKAYTLEYKPENYTKHLLHLNYGKDT